jgi:predicted dehydrogenase
MSGRVRAGVIGCGYWGPNLIRNFVYHEDATVSAVCDTVPERAERMARTYGVPLASTNPEEVIGSPDVDVVVVATPARTHAPLARAAIEAGKHVVIMKPMTTSSEDAE